MASGHVNRTNRPNTWLHRPNLRRGDFPCQPGAVHTWHMARDKGCPQSRRVSEAKGPSADASGASAWARRAANFALNAAANRRSHHRHPAPEVWSENGLGIRAWTPRTISTTWVTRKLAAMLQSAYASRSLILAWAARNLIASRAAMRHRDVEVLVEAQRYPVGIASRPPARRAVFCLCRITWTRSFLHAGLEWR